MRAEDWIEKFRVRKFGDNGDKERHSEVVMIVVKELVFQESLA